MSGDHHNPMTPKRFRELLDAYGAEPGRWPAVERASAEALLRTDAEAARLVAEAAQLDELLALDAQRDAQPSPALRARVAEVPLRHPVSTAPAAGRARLRASFGMALAGAFAVAVGLVAGALVDAEAAVTEEATAATDTTTATATTETDTADTDADVTADDGWDELAALAFADDYQGEP